MFARIAITWLASLLAVMMLPVSLTGIRSAPTTESAPASVEETPAVSLDPSVNVADASSGELRRLADALDRFARMGLELPDLEVRFSEDDADCNGHDGRFAATADPPRVSICSELGWVYEHELAHAWEGANLTDQARQTFMSLRGYEVWAGHHVPWKERGMEGVAFTVQQGLSGLPLPPVLSDEHCGRLLAFQLLTGRPDPRLDDWVDSRTDDSESRPVGHDVRGEDPELPQAFDGRGCQEPKGASPSWS